MTRFQETEYPADLIDPLVLMAAGDDGDDDEEDEDEDYEDDEDEENVFA